MEEPEMTYKGIPVREFLSKATEEERMEYFRRVLQYVQQAMLEFAKKED